MTHNRVSFKLNYKFKTLDNVISYDVEREFEYAWGFGRQKAILIDYLSARSQKEEFVVLVPLLMQHDSCIYEAQQGQECIKY